MNIFSSQVFFFCSHVRLLTGNRLFFAYCVSLSSCILHVGGDPEGAGVGLLSLPVWVGYALSAVTFGAGFVGVSYAVLTSSWDDPSSSSSTIIYDDDDDSLVSEDDP